VVLYQPPKGHVDNEKTPTTPKLTIENARSPRAFSFFRAMAAGDETRGFDVVFRSEFQIAGTASVTFSLVMPALVAGIHVLCRHE
jgi:hypothetical protein